MINNQLLIAINSQAGKHELVDFVFVFLAEALVFLVLIAAIGIHLYKKDFVRLALMLTSVVVSLCVSYLIGLVFFEARPIKSLSVNQLVYTFDPYAFPSKHATMSSAIAANVYFLNRSLGYAFFFGAIMIGLARVYVGVHYPFDIVAGLFLGWFVSLIVKSSYQLIIKLKIFRTVDKY